MDRLLDHAVTISHKSVLLLPLLSAVVFFLVCSHTDAQRVRVIGPEQQSFGGGRQNALGATLIINDLDFSEGILFAFSTYVEERTNFRFQMWRPIDNETSLEYQLISERAATPTVVGREDFYVADGINSDCAVVRPGDRLGLYFEELPWAIGYVFDAETLPQTLLFTVNVSEPINQFDTVEFALLSFPYRFSVTAYVDTEIANITIDENGQTRCPPGLIIPPYVPPTTPTTTPPVPITGAPGVPGATGPEGPIGATGPIGPQGEPGNMTIGDTGATGPRGIQGATGIVGPEGEMGLQGFNGSMGATGLPGEVGATGMIGPVGAPGEQGPMPSLDGVYNFTEEFVRLYVDNALRNISNSTQPVAEAQTSGDDDDDDFFEEADTLMYAYIWLGVLTLLLLIFFIILMVLCRRTRRLQREYAQLKKNDNYSVNNAYVNTGLAATNEQRHKELNDREHALNEREAELKRQDSSKWMHSLKPDQFMDYEVSTIERQTSQRHRQNRSNNSAAMAQSAPDLYEGTAEADKLDGAQGGTLSQEDVMY